MGSKTISSTTVIQICVLMCIISGLTLETEKENRNRNSGKKNYHRQSLVSVTPKTKDDCKYLLKMAKTNNGIDLWQDILSENQKVLMQVHHDRLNYVKKQLKRKHIPFQVMFFNLQRLVDEEQRETERNLKSHLSNLDEFRFDVYHSTSDIEKFLKHLTEMNKNVSHLRVIGNSYYEKPLYAVEVSSSHEENHRRKRKKKNRKPHKQGSAQESWLEGSKKKMIVLDCGVHAREWISIAFCVYFINEVVIAANKGSEEFDDVLDKYDFIIIPVVNPDGYEHTRTKDRLWRKTLSKNESHPGCIGVDANRNFDVNVHECVKYPCSNDYCGSQPFSESETASLNRLLIENYGRVKGYFSFHSFGQMWLFPWAKTKDVRPKDYEMLFKAGQAGVDAIKQKFGTEYTLGMASEVIYDAAGTALDYVYEKDLADYSFTLELRDKGDHGFFLPEDLIIPTCKETTDGVLASILAME